MKNNGQSDSYGVLKDSNGTVYQVKVFQDDEESLDNNQYKMDFFFKIGSSGMTKVIDKEQNLRGQSSNENWDSSISVYGKVSFTYYKSGTYYLMNNVSGYWENHDNHVSLSNRHVVYCCMDTSTYYSQWAHKTGLAMSWSYNTGFSTYVNSNILSACSAKSFVTLSHGSSSVWTFELETTLFNSFGGIFSL